MFQIDVMSRTPVYEQIIEQTERYILKRLITPGDKLPSVRQLSMELSINPNTIQKAYSELDRRGWIYSVPGKGCFISENALHIIAENKRGKLKELELIMKELALAGVTKEEILACVTKVFCSQEPTDGPNLSERSDSI